MEDSNTYRMIVLEPDIHYIDKISLNKPSFDTYRYYPSPGLKDDTLIYGGFEVKGGEVLAIGKLIIFPDEGVFKYINDF